MAEDGSQRGLVERAQRGDADAFARLVERELDGAWRFVRAISGHVDVEDVVQEAFVMAWRDLPRLRDPDAFEPWLRAVLVHATHHELRRASRVRLIPIAAEAITDDGLSPEGLALSGPGPEPGSFAASRDVVERAFARLTLDERTVLVLHHIEGWPMERIAMVMGRPVGTAKSRIHAARRALRAALAAEEREVERV